MKLVYAALAAGFLCVLPLLVAAPTSLASSPSATPRDEVSFHVSAYMRDESNQIASLDNPGLHDVIRTLALTAGGGSTASVRAALYGTYPGLVSEENALGYKSVWDDEQSCWKWVCCNSSFFEVSLPAGVVRVDSEEGTIVL